MPRTDAAARRPVPSSQSQTLQIVTTVAASFACYLAIGIPLATLPTYVHLQLGFSAVIAGLAISLQYVATLLTRARAGHMADAIGSKRTVLYGLAACGGSSVLLLAAALTSRIHWVSLPLLIASRLTLGFGESCVATAAIIWGIGRVGEAGTAEVISWNGVATYGAIGLGAPLGVALERWLGFPAAAAAGIPIAAAGWLFASLQPAAPVIHGERLPFSRVLTRILPFGAALGLGSAGFGAIATFITLFYASRGWGHAAEALTAFGACFIGCRLLFVRTISRHGGYRVAMACFAVEGAGLALLALARTPALAFGAAALSGFGFALVFPALGVEAVAQVPAQSRGAALGAYGSFFDLALGLTGPLMGLVVAARGYPTAFLGIAAAASAGGLVTLGLFLAGRPRVETLSRQAG
jgi:MFS family permease